jgi:hypothetical protein
MCIAIYKPENADFPSKKTLQRCFDSNPDGAGFMFAHRDAVHIRKGFTSFKAFWRDLRGMREKITDQPAFVLHFRISTQAGTRPDCTHPFPLSRKMDDLRALRATADIGIAHNGIITLTSQGYNKTITYSDTMQFITDYAARLIKSRDWCDDDDLRAVIENMAGSRLAILDGGGKCTLLGSGWIEDGGCWYSNTSYLPTPARTTYTSPLYGFRAYDWHDWYDEPAEPAQTAEPDDGGDPWSEWYDKQSGLYFFDDLTCPATSAGDPSYCRRCACYGDCYGFTE